MITPFDMSPPHMSTGIDLAEIDRFKDLVENPAFMKRVFTLREADYIASRGVFAPSSAAGIFAAKEALSKALGCGLGPMGIKDAEVGHDAAGRPYYVFNGGLKARLEGCAVSLSITHTDDTAAAVCVLTGSVSVRPRRADGWTPPEGCVPLTGEIAAAALPPRDSEGNKYDFGVAVMFAGSVGYSGAACLAAGAAVRSGVGLVRLCVPEAIYAIAAAKLDEPVVTPLPSAVGVFAPLTANELEGCLQKATSLLVGCGIGRSKSHMALVSRLLDMTSCPIVLDADGINCLEGDIYILKRHPGRVILTPHDGELKRLTGRDIPGDLPARRNLALAFAQGLGQVLVMKGPHTLVASPEGNVFLSMSGNDGMAKGGSGDVLAGIIAALAARGASVTGAASAGVYLHSLAGDICASRLGRDGMTPGDMIDTLPSAFMTLY